MRLSRPRKSGRFLAFGGFGAGGGESKAMSFPRFLIPTTSPSSIQQRTLPKSCRNCRTVAIFMCNKHVTLLRACQPLDGWREGPCARERQPCGRREQTGRSCSATPVISSILQCIKRKPRRAITGKSVPGLSRLSDSRLGRQGDQEGAAAAHRGDKVESRDLDLRPGVFPRAHIHSVVGVRAFPGHPGALVI